MYLLFMSMSIISQLGACCSLLACNVPVPAPLKQWTGSSALASLCAAPDLRMLCLARVQQHPDCFVFVIFPLSNGPGPDDLDILGACPYVCLDS